MHVSWFVFIFHTGFFLEEQFIRTTRLKFAQKLRTSLEQSRLGFGIIYAKFSFLNNILLFSSNSTVSSVEILQMLRSIKFTLQCIRLHDQKLGTIGIF